MNALTSIQIMVLEFIVLEVRNSGLPPTHREIATHFKWRSKAAAASHLLALEKKGFIHTRIRSPRAIELKPSALSLFPENIPETSNQR